MTGDTGPDDEIEEGVTDDSPPAERGTSSPVDDTSPDDATGGRPDDTIDPPGGDGPPGDSGGSDGGRSNDDWSDDNSDRRGADPERVEGLVGELESLRNEVDRLETRVDEKTVHRDDIEAELRRYVRARQRRGHATGWGPYLVLLYGVVMTVGAFFYLGGLVALAAMIVVWLSTLGLYVVMVIASAGISVARRVAGLRDLIGKFR